MKLPAGLRRKAALLLWLLAGISTAGAVPLQGTLTADRDCPAFVSKNKSTNPDDSHITAGNTYIVIEANKPDAPDWYRLRLPAANPPERWVSRDCGHTAQASAEAPPTEDSGSCGLAGEADAYVLALSWHPAFCELKPGGPDCRPSSRAAYAARNFTLHGLWPNKSNCGTDYGFCGTVKHPLRNFCDYPPVALAPATRDGLTEVMPGSVQGACLERHEWHKHGTCQTGWTSDVYFSLAANLTRQFNASGIADFLAPRIGGSVQTEEFLARLNETLGPQTRDRIRLSCEQGMLVELRIMLPSHLAQDAKLESLLPLAGKNSGSNCGDSFRLGPMGR